MQVTKNSACNRHKWVITALVLVSSLTILHFHVGSWGCEDVRTVFGLFGNHVECKIPKYSEKDDISALVTSVKDFIAAYDNLPRTSHGIPKVVHQIYIGTAVPKHYVQYVKTIDRAMPSWMHVLWTDEDIERSLLPRVSAEDRALFHRYPQAINRADMTRYLLMEEFGGMYLDMDAELLKDVEPNLISHGGIWAVHGFQPHAGSRDPPKVESHMWVSQPQHPFWKVMRELLHERGDGIRYKLDYDVLTVTGPRAVQDAKLRYEAQKQPEKTFGTFLLFDSNRYNFGRGDGDGVAHHHFVHEWLWIIKRVNIQRVLRGIGFFTASGAVIFFVWQQWTLRKEKRDM